MCFRIVMLIGEVFWGDGFKVIDIKYFILENKVFVIIEC